MLSFVVRPKTGAAASTAPPWRRRARLFARLMFAVLLLEIWILWFLPNGFGGPVGVTWVSGISMEPTLYTGDLVITYERETYGVGDVVSFEIPNGGVVIHRIIEITDDGLYRFQGDSRPYEDPWTLPAESIVGSAVFEVHNASTIVAYLTRPVSLGLMVAAIVGLSMWQRDPEGGDPVIDLTGGVGEDRGAHDGAVIDLTEGQSPIAGSELST